MHAESRGPSHKWEGTPEAPESPEVAGFEPWPWILAACLLAMISISSTFAWVATTHPDPVVVDESYEADAETFAPRFVDQESAP